MFISKLDFLSSPPQLCFLKKRTSKTIFGGVLFIIYCLMMATIFIFYTIDFYLNDKYDIRYSLYKNFTSDTEEYNKKEKINPHLNFSFELKRFSDDLRESILPEDFIILDENGMIIERNSIISKTTSNFSFTIVKFCVFDCIFDEDNETDLFYVLNISYSGYKIDHENNEIPFEENSDKYIFYKEIFFSKNRTSVVTVNWEVIKYKEERGLLGLFDNFNHKKDEYTAIDIDSIEQTYMERILEERNEELPGLSLRLICNINMENKHNQYIEYKRIKKSLLDVFANICALYSTIFTIFSYMYKMITRNYNNYQIINEVLSVNDKIMMDNNIKIPRSKTIKFENIHIRKKNIMNKDNQSFDTSKSVPFKSKGIDINRKIEIKKETNINYNYKLIEINLICFLLSNIYYKRKKMKKELKNINICNDIIFKYISIDNILYNQIIFENLLKDYKWNDNCLKNIVNNNNIKKLKLKLIT